MSSYLVLARKYRPRSFPEVVGQEVVTRVLSGALEEGRIGHAYLFCGPRGTGKTTIARILAKCLNCESGPTANPCGTCERCTAADSGAEVDIIELDAASHTGVDTIRELRDEAAYAPMRARHKVYIIDEVHMLSKGAFNALLKTLEEPPPHVVFLFATTEPHKVLDTILSRCQVLRLEPLPEARIAERLVEVLKLEGVTPEAGLVEELARGARGGMRDALSLTDQLLSLAGSNPTLADLERLGGDGGTRVIGALLTGLESGDRRAVLEAAGDFGGRETELLDGLMSELRKGVVLAHCGAETPLVTGSPEERTALAERAQRLGSERIELWLQECLRARERMRLLPGSERVVLEVTLLDLCRPEATQPLSLWIERLESLEERLGGASGASPRSSAQGEAPARSVEAPPPAPVEREVPRAPDRGVDPQSLWEPFLEELGRSHGALSEALSRQGRLETEGKGVARIVLFAKDQASERLVRDRRMQGACKRAFEKVAGADWSVTLVADEEPEATPPPKPAVVEEPKPKPQKDEFTSEVADLFGGVIEDLT